MEPYMSEIRAFSAPFAPQGWAFCNGQSVSIEQNTALFSLLGTSWGGDGNTTFALPDLRGRIPVGPNDRTDTKIGHHLGPKHDRPKPEHSQSWMAVGFCIALHGMYPTG
jgi:microcystin-dependent protein